MRSPPPSLTTLLLPNTPSSHLAAAWQRGRVLVRREHSVRLYGMLPFALATGLTWAPVVTLRTVLFSVCYWLAHLQFKADKYFIFLAAQWLMNASAREPA